MIQVKELTKVYKSRKSGNCTALDHISFTLPDKGFVFVIGKSGSGKTTLLSLLGGLDTITSGEIIENGRHIEKFGLKEQVYFRNSTIGFIFQDFHLIDDLTIYENIKFALELQGEEDDEKVKKALADTDLSDYGKRYPKELSGGQKQRVAIARALVKQPSIILADEPTGNLDSKTTAQILGLLKELSKEKLVVIVSHNLSDAEHYADEILELSDGKILRHLKRNENFDERLRVENDTLIIPVGERFDDETIKAVGNAMKATHVTDVRQQKDRFLPYGEAAASMPEEKPIARAHLRAKHTAKLSAKFARRSLLRTCVYSVIFAAVLVVLGLSQLIMNFNGGEVVVSEMAKRNLSCDSFMKDDNDTYDSVDTTRLVDVEANDLQKFYDAGYEGKVYPLVNYSFLNTSSSIDVNQKRPTLRADPYALTGSTGVLITEEKFLQEKYGALKYVALSNAPKDYGVYLTDYFADAYLANHPTVTSYEQLLDSTKQFTGYVYGYVNGVIDTGYKERYRDLLAKLSDPNLSKAELEKISESDECLTFLDELCQYLSIAFSFEPDFVENAIASGVRQFVSTGISTFTYYGRTSDYSESWFSSDDMRSSARLGENEILMNYDVYNQIFGANYTPQSMWTFKPHEVRFSYYLQCDRNKSQKKYETTLNIVGLNNNTVHVNMADNIFREIGRAEMFTFGYYFDNAEQAERLFNTASDLGVIPNSSIALRKSVEVN